MLQNIGFSEFVLIAIAALVLFGPDKMPELGRKLGRIVREFRSGAASFLSEVTRDPEQRRASGTGQTPPSPAATAAEASQPVQAGINAQTAPTTTEAAGNVQTSPLAAKSSPESAPQQSPVSSAPTPKPHRAADPRRLPE